MVPFMSYRNRKDLRMLSISQLLRFPVTEETDIYENVGFRRVVEDHLEWLRNHPENSSLEVTAVIAEKYKGDLAGLLVMNEYHPRYHWTIARINGFACCADNNADLRNLIIPPPGVIDELLENYTTTASQM